MSKHQQHATVADGHACGLTSPDTPPHKHQSQQQNQRWVQVQNEPLQRRRDVLQPGKIEKARQVIAGKTQPDNAKYVLARQRRRLALRRMAAGPPAHRQKERQRKQHAQHDERHSVDSVAVRQLDNDGLATERDSAQGGKRQTSCY